MAKPLIEITSIYDTAIKIVNSQGAEKLSIRKLTSALQCSPNTIYLQIGNRDDLVGGMLQHFFEQRVIALDQHASWQNQCRQWAYELHKTLLDKPNLARLIGWQQRQIITDCANILLQALLKVDFEPEFALRCVRVLSNETISMSLMEIETPPVEVRRKKRSSKEVTFERRIIASQSNLNASKEFHGQSEIFESAIEFTIRGIESVLEEFK